MLTLADWESARVVSDDLEYLTEKWVPAFDEGALRRDSPLLRRLLVEGQYPKSWTALGLPDEPYVSAADLDAALGNVNRDYLQYAIAPAADEVGLLMEAALREGTQVKVHYMVIEDIPPGAVVALPAEYPRRFGAALVAIPPDVVAREGGEEVVRQLHAQFGVRKVRALPLSEYLQSPAALVGGVAVSRGDLIRYVTNKLGGAHFDSDRSRPGDSRLALLDHRLAVVEPEHGVGINNVYAEALSIAQAVAGSTDAARFRETFAVTEKPT